jgi:hypothetical protein
MLKWMPREGIDGWSTLVCGTMCHPPCPPLDPSSLASIRGNMPPFDSNHPLPALNPPSPLHECSILHSAAASLSRLHTITFTFPRPQISLNPHHHKADRLRSTIDRERSRLRELRFRIKISHQRQYHPGLAWQGARRPTGIRRPTRRTTPLGGREARSLLAKRESQDQ